MKTKVFYNAVVQEDLFYTIVDYITCHKNLNYLLDEFDNMTLDDWKRIAKDSIMWLESHELQNIDTLGDVSPSKDTWGTLYYQMLAYLDRSKQYKKLHGMSQEGLIITGKECINDLKKMIDMMHEPTDEDIEKI